MVKGGKELVGKTVVFPSGFEYEIMWVYLAWIGIKPVGISTCPVLRWNRVEVLTYGKVKESVL